MKKRDLEDAVADFEATYGYGQAEACKICDSEHHELINTLLARGAGGERLQAWLWRARSFKVGASTIRRHAREHLNAELSAS